MIAKTTSLPVRKLVDKGSHETVRYVEVRSRFFETPVVIRSAGRHRAVRVSVRQILGPGVEPVYEQAVAVTPFYPDGGAVVGVVPEVRIELNLAELGIRLKILHVPADVVERGVIGGDVQRNNIDIPVVQQ